MRKAIDPFKGRAIGHGLPIGPGAGQAAVSNHHGIGCDGRPMPDPMPDLNVVGHQRHRGFQHNCIVDQAV